MFFSGVRIKEAQQQQAVQRVNDQSEQQNAPKLVDLIQKERQHVNEELVRVNAQIAAKAGNNNVTNSLENKQLLEQQQRLAKNAQVLDSTLDSFYARQIKIEKELPTTVTPQNWKEERKELQQELPKRNENLVKSTEAAKIVLTQKDTAPAAKVVATEAAQELKKSNVVLQETLVAQFMGREVFAKRIKEEDAFSLGVPFVRPVAPLEAKYTSEFMNIKNKMLKELQPALRDPAFDRIELDRLYNQIKDLIIDYFNKIHVVEFTKQPIPVILHDAKAGDAAKALMALQHLHKFEEVVAEYLSLFVLYSERIDVMYWAQEFFPLDNLASGRDPSYTELLDWRDRLYVETQKWLPQRDTYRKQFSEYSNSFVRKTTVELAQNVKITRDQAQQFVTLPATDSKQCIDAADLWTNVKKYWQLFTTHRLKAIKEINDNPYNLRVPDMLKKDLTSVQDAMNAATAARVCHAADITIFQTLWKDLPNIDTSKIPVSSIQALYLQDLKNDITNVKVAANAKLMDQQTLCKKTGISAEDQQKCAQAIAALDHIKQDADKLLFEAQIIVAKEELNAQYLFTPGVSSATSLPSPPRVATPPPRVATPPPKPIDPTKVAQAQTEIATALTEAKTQQAVATAATQKAITAAEEVKIAKTNGADPAVVAAAEQKVQDAVAESQAAAAAAQQAVDNAKTAAANAPGVSLVKIAEVEQASQKASEASTLATDTANAVNVVVVPIPSISPIPAPPVLNPTPKIPAVAPKTPVVVPKIPIVPKSAPTPGATAYPLFDRSKCEALIPATASHRDILLEECTKTCRDNKDRACTELQNIASIQCVTGTNDDLKQKVGLKISLLQNQYRTACDTLKSCDEFDTCRQAYLKVVALDKKTFTPLKYDSAIQDAIDAAESNASSSDVGETPAAPDLSGDGGGPAAPAFEDIGEGGGPTAPAFEGVGEGGGPTAPSLESTPGKKTAPSSKSTPPPKQNPCEAKGAKFEYENTNQDCSAKFKIQALLDECKRRRALLDHCATEYDACYDNFEDRPDEYKGMEQKEWTEKCVGDERKCMRKDIQTYMCNAQLTQCKTTASGESDATKKTEELKLCDTNFTGCMLPENLLKYTNTKFLEDIGNVEGSVKAVKEAVLEKLCKPPVNDPKKKDLCDNVAACTTAESCQEECEKVKALPFDPKQFCDAALDVYIAKPTKANAAGKPANPKVKAVLTTECQTKCNESNQDSCTDPMIPILQCKFDNKPAVTTKADADCLAMDCTDLKNCQEEFEKVVARNKIKETASSGLSLKEAAAARKKRTGAK